MNFSGSLHQIYFYFIISLFISISVNLIRIKPLPLVAEKLETIKNIDQINEKISNPIIREINLDIAKNLFQNNMLFIDARAKQYYDDGHIPESICNDDLDDLINEIENRISLDAGFVVYCSDDECGSSEELAISLQEQGFMNIFLFKGGWKQWTENNLPINKVK